MKIIQAPEITAEVKELQLVKATLENDIHVLRTSLREYQSSLADTIEREKAFKDSFIGNAEWLKKIQELRKVYDQEVIGLDEIQADARVIKEQIQCNKKEFQNQCTNIKNLTKEVSYYMKQAVERQERVKQIKEEEKNLEEKVFNLTQELKILREEKPKLEAELEKKLNYCSMREQELTQKELNLRVYEQRIVREYAILFPEIKL